MGARAVEPRRYQRMSPSLTRASSSNGNLGVRKHGSFNKGELESDDSNHHHDRKCNMELHQSSRQVRCILEHSEHPLQYDHQNEALGNPANHWRCFDGQDGEHERTDKTDQDRGESSMDLDDAAKLKRESMGNLLTTEIPSMRTGI